MAMCTKGSGTNSVNPPVSRCRARVTTRWRAHERGCSIAPNMIVTFERRPTAWAARCASSHCSVLTLSGQSTARTSSSRISAAVPGRVLSPASRSVDEVLGERHPRAPGALGHLEGGEGVDVDPLRAGPDRLDHVEVVVAVEARVDATLEADLGRALRLGLGHPAGDLLQLEQVRGAAQVERQRALGEGAEPALERADVGVVDVPVGDEGDRVAHDLGPQLVGQLGDRPHLRPRRREQRDDLVLADLLAARAPRPGPRRPRPVAEAGRETGRGRAAPAARRRRPSTTRRRGPRPSASERSRTKNRMLVVEPALGFERELGVDREAGRERVAGRLGRRLEAFERRPGPLGVHVVGRHRRDPAPVVDPGRRAGPRGRR